MFMSTLQMHDTVYNMTCTYLAIDVLYSRITYFYVFILTSFSHISKLRLNGDVVGVIVACSNDTLEGVLQLSEVQAGFRLIAPANQHQLVPDAMTGNDNHEGVVKDYCTLLSAHHECGTLAYSDRCVMESVYGIHNAQTSG